jgi:CRP-like cAMP-binding protein
MLRNTYRPITLDFIAKHGGKVREYKRQAPVYRQGDPAHELFYVLSGKVLVTISTEAGKEALIAVLPPGQFFGEDCVDREALRNSTVTAATDCKVAAFSTSEVIHAFSNDLEFTKCFAGYLMELNKQLKKSLVDQMLLSSEKRLARLLLRLVPAEKEIEPELVDVLTNQDMIARMVGTTRPRINQFMNKFRKMGFIEYSHGKLKVHGSLNSILIGNEM